MRGLLLQAGMALGALVWAYATWTRDPGERDEAAATVFACQPEALRYLELETPHYTHRVEPVGQGQDRYYAITTRDAPEPDAPAAAAAREERYVANAELERYLTRLLPLRAERVLGQLPAARLPEFGLAEPEVRFTLACAGRSLSLDVGARSFGSGRRYVRRRDTQVVFVIPGALIQDLQSARYKLKLTAALAFDLERAQRVSVQLGQGDTAARRDLVRGAGGAAGTGQPWVAADEPTLRNALYGNWLTRVHRLRLRTYLPAGAAPGADLPDPHDASELVLKVRYQGDGGPLDELKIARVMRDGRAHYYGRTRATRTWVTLLNSAAHQVVQDARMVVEEGASGSNLATPAGVQGQTDGATQVPVPAPDPKLEGMPSSHPPLPPGRGL